MSKKIIVTGGAGFIGSHLIKYLLKETGIQVLNIDALTYAGNLTSLREIENEKNYQFLKGSICDPELLARVFQDFQPDGVMHLAAESHVDRSIAGPHEFIQTNIVGTFNLLQASLNHLHAQATSAKETFRFLHVSTDEVFGSLEPGEPGFNEKTPYDPHTPYSASKASSDHLVRAWGETYGLPILITNCSNNYGPNQFPEKLIPVVILRALAGEPIPIYGNGENIRDWLYVRDHAIALHTVFENGKVGETYTIGANNEHQNIELVKSICAILDGLKPRADGQPYASQIQFVPDRPGHDLRYAIDSSKIRSELGWKPLEKSQSGLTKTVQWYLDNQEWWQEVLSS